MISNGVKRNLLALVLFIFLAIAGISGFVLAYSKETDLTNQAVEPVFEPVLQPVFDPAILNWEKVSSAIPWEARDSQAVVVSEDKIWLTGGMQFEEKILNDIWYSENGKDWFLATASAPWAARQGHGLVSYKDKLWIAGQLDVKAVGGKNDVWFSTF